MNKLDSLNRWLTLIANFGVIVGIVFLAVEIRENTKATQANGIQTASALDQEHLLLIGSDPHLAAIWRTYLMAPNTLSENERRQCDYIFASLIRRLNNVFIQYEMGALSVRSWESRKDLLQNIARGPGFEAFLDSPVALFADQVFLDYMKNLRDEAP